MAGLYTALARGGEPLALKYRLTGEPLRHAAAEPLLRPAAAWYVADILRGAAPPAHAKGGGIAFKTGTSYGFRDAWAAGFDGRHVVVAWLGRPDGTPTPGLMGLTKAAPMLFDIFAQIGPDRVPLPAAAGRRDRGLDAAPCRRRSPISASRKVRRRTDISSADPPIHIAFPPDRAELELAQ